MAEERNVANPVEHKILDVTGRRDGQLGGIVIIQLRGTNGSGKSTIVREVMKRFKMLPEFIERRKQPIGYYSTGKDKPKLWVVGHYETDCGGCDTITSLDDVYGEIEKSWKAGYNVLCEGIMASGEYRRCVNLHQTTQDVFVLALDTPIEDCIQSVMARRVAKGRGDKPFSPDRTIRRVREVTSMMEHLKVCNVPARWTNRNEALQICLKELGAI